FDEDQAMEKKGSLDHSHFVSHQTLDLKVLWDNINLESSVFRHSIRVSISCIVGYIIVNTISYGNYNYWILLTIAFILKPEFSLTKSRNIQRLIGTLIGGAIGVTILIFIPNKSIQFIFLVLFMIGNYSFMRINYLIMVICVTPFVLILFNFLGEGFIELATERILDTVIGCAIAISASYFLFPKWESEHLKVYLANMLKANAAYLEKIVEGLSGKTISELDYKLVRKEVYVSSANLAATFQRMLSEPKSKQSDTKKVHQFVVLNHILFSNMATVATTLVRKEPRLHPSQVIIASKNSLSHLNAVTNNLTGKETTSKNIPPSPRSILQETETISADDVLLKNQLDFISRTVKDIEKIVTTIA
ncbi:MAG: FUSC family protein, partial [Flavisolibacter sp.]